LLLHYSTTLHPCSSLRPRHTTARDGGNADFAGAKIYRASMHIKKAGINPAFSVILKLKN